MACFSTTRGRKLCAACWTEPYRAEVPLLNCDGSQRRRSQIVSQRKIVNSKRNPLVLNRFWSFFILLFVHELMIYKHSWCITITIGVLQEFRIHGFNRTGVTAPTVSLLELLEEASKTYPQRDAVAPWWKLFQIIPKMAWSSKLMSFDLLTIYDLSYIIHIRFS